MTNLALDTINERLERIKEILKNSLDRTGTQEILNIIGITTLDQSDLANIKLYSEYVPKAVDIPYSEEQRFLHFLWDSFEHSPLGPVTNFAFPFRRILAKKLFLHCGKNFCSEAIHFNFGHLITAGDNVFINVGTLIDSKGGVTIGESVGIGEFVRIYTHTHSESNHAERTYAPVIIGDYSKVYSGATLLPGVTIGEQAIVAGSALVTKDVPPNMVVAGIPAKVIRERKTEGRFREQLNHVWFHNRAHWDE